jgi:hypothetical protein
MVITKATKPQNSTTINLNESMVLRAVFKKLLSVAEERDFKSL